MPQQTPALQKTPRRRFRTQFAHRDLEKPRFGILQPPPGLWRWRPRMLDPPFLKPGARLGLYSRNPGFTDTRLRPFALRREMTPRPPCDFIRVRKPWVFERRRRFGWNVRFG